MKPKQIYCVKSNIAGKQSVRLVILLLLLFLLIGANELSAQTLKICHKNGTESTCNTSDIQKLIFSSGNMYLHRINNESQEFAILDIRRLVFSDVSSEVVSYENPNKEGFFIYPNPVDNNLILEFELDKKRTVQVQFFSLDGTLLSNQTHYLLNPGKVMKRISVKGLTPGVYICHLNDGFSIMSKKFIKK